jgi:GNAT superfamily N-acetyltransferase
MKGKRSLYSIRKFTLEDEDALISLLETQYPWFLKDTIYAWKYKKNPNFNPSFVAVAEHQGKIIGCNHWLPRKLKLSNKLQVSTVLAADLLVNRQYRGQGIGSDLLRILRTSELIERNGITLSYTFPAVNLNKKLYEPVAGYVAAPYAMKTYKRFFSCRELQQKIELIDKKVKANNTIMARLHGFDLHVAFKLLGFPAFSLGITSEGIAFSEKTIKKPDIVIEGIIPLTAGIIDGNIRTRVLIKSLISGRLKIKKGITKVLKMKKAFSILQEASFS